MVKAIRRSASLVIGLALLWRLSGNSVNLSLAFLALALFTLIFLWYDGRTPAATSSEVTETKTEVKKEEKKDDKTKVETKSTEKKAEAKVKKGWVPETVSGALVLTALAVILFLVLPIAAALTLYFNEDIRNASYDRAVSAGLMTAAQIDPMNEDMRAARREDCVQEKRLLTREYIQKRDELNRSRPSSNNPEAFAQWQKLKIEVERLKNAQAEMAKDVCTAEDADPTNSVAADSPGAFGYSSEDLETKFKGLDEANQIWIVVLLLLGAASLAYGMKTKNFTGAVLFLGGAVALFYLSGPDSRPDGIFVRNNPQYNPNYGKLAPWDTPVPPLVQEAPAPTRRAIKDTAPAICDAVFETDDFQTSRWKDTGCYSPESSYRVVASNYQAPADCDSQSCGELAFPAYPAWSLIYRDAQGRTHALGEDNTPADSSPVLPRGRNSIQVAINQPLGWSNKTGGTFAITVAPAQ